MAQALEEYKIDVLEKLGELGRQMEEVNGKEKSLKTATDESGVEDQELSLNVEKPADETSIDALGKENVEEAVTEDPLTSKDAEPEKAESVKVKEPEAEKGQQPVTEDEVGINLDDDELWDDGEVEEIPLFEEELLSEISQEEEKEKQANNESKPSEPLVEDGPEGSEGLSDESGEELLADEGQGSEEAEKKQEDSEDNQVDEVEDLSPKDAPGLASRLLPWIVTGFSSILIILAVLTIYLMWSGPANQQAKVLESSQPVSTQKIVKRAEKKVNIQSPTRARQGFEAIDLAPFIIPGKSGGELVFFKLQVELIVQDALTKQELMRRQAWLRDIIYQELKGLDISRGIQGDILDRYRAPLLKRLNMEFSPLKIKDIRLMGYLLR